MGLSHKFVEVQIKKKGKLSKSRKEIGLSDIFCRIKMQFGL
jgi:hypothetical protein